MLRFPVPLRQGDKIGVTAPSAGAEGAGAERIDFCVDWLRRAGYDVVVGDCMDGAGITSAPAADRAAELSAMLCDPTIRCVVPPWGGETGVAALCSGHQDATMSDMSPGEPIPSELLEGVGKVTPGRLLVMRFVLVPVCVLCSAGYLALADHQRGPGLEPAAATTSVVVCLLAALLGRERIHRLQRLSLDRLRKGQRPTGTTRRPNPAVGAVKMLIIGLFLLVAGYPVAVASNDALPWPSTAFAVFFAFVAGGFTARVPVWIRERRWPSPDGPGDA